jgi:hypothetical protein
VELLPPLQPLRVLQQTQAQQEGLKQQQPQLQALLLLQLLLRCLQGGGTVPVAAGQGGQ